MPNAEFNDSLSVEEALAKVATLDVVGGGTTAATKRLMEFIENKFKPGTYEATPPIDDAVVEGPEALIRDVLADLGIEITCISYYRI